MLLILIAILALASTSWAALAPASEAGAYISLLSSQDLCLGRASNSSGESSSAVNLGTGNRTWTGLRVGLVDCASAEKWLVGGLPGDSEPLRFDNGTLTAVPVGTNGIDFADATEIGFTVYDYHPSLQPGYLWYWTTDSQLQFLAAGNICIEGDKDTKLVTPRPCADVSAQSWTSRRVTGSVNTSGIATSPTYADPVGGSRIHALSRDDLCVTIQPASNPDTPDDYSGSIANSNGIAIATCVPNDNSLSGFQLFALALPGNFSTANYTGPLQIINSTAVGDQSRKYCLTGSAKPRNGSAILVQECNSSPGQQWIANNRTISLQNTVLRISGATPGRVALALWPYGPSPSLLFRLVRTALIFRTRPGLVNTDICIEADTKTKAVTTQPCSDKASQSFAFRSTVTLLNSSSIPIGTTYPDPQGGSRIRALGRNDLCVSVAPSSDPTGSLAPGDPIYVARCLDNSNLNVGFQLFALALPGDFSTANYTGALQVMNSTAIHDRTQNLCLGVGDNPTNGSNLAVQECNASPGQHWLADNSTISVQHTNMCLDVVRGSGTPPGAEGSFLPYFTLQMWTCNPGDPQQPSGRQRHNRVAKRKSIPGVFVWRFSLLIIHLTRRWSWTANNAIQHYVDRDLCLQGDHTTGHVIPAKCSGKSDQAWSFRYTAGVLTDAVVPIGVVYSDPQGSHRIRGLGRDDLCVSSEAYPGSGNYDETLFPSLTASNYTGSLFAGLTATFAQCVSNDSPITSFQLFEPFSSGSGPIKFENSSAASNRSSYCIDAGDSPVNGSVVLVQTCKNGAVGQQWSTTNTSIALSGQNLCLQTGSEMYGGGRNEGDYTPIFVLQVFTCNNALKQQTFTTYAGENVAPPISTSRA
ncbi:hypothetical protein M231_03213 [Tremella mesenterica]|uniref:Ricin B lectin domain-containing protein n=1 Tax=Tremella mesenterica TaxID=5217 RepID=A0A4Q1BNU0_TREME|nr:hypothetical protein M231_03213 [Tremella mesenterica]